MDFREFLEKSVVPERDVLDEGESKEKASPLGAGRRRVKESFQ